jgi:hypothetical protein
VGLSVLPDSVDRTEEGIVKTKRDRTIGWRGILDDMDTGDWIAVALIVAVSVMVIVLAVVNEPPAVGG